MSAATLPEQLEALERMLLDPAVRADRERVDALIAEDFLEIGALGAVFGKSDVLARLPDELGVVFEVDAMRVHAISNDVVRLLYAARRSAEDGVRKSLRSSWWRREAEGRWRMVFHQGTPATGAGTI